MTPVLGLPLVLALAVAESAISLPSTSWGRPDFVLVAVLAAGLRWGARSAAVTAVVGGIVLEYQSSAPAGTMFAPLIVLGLLSALPRRGWEWRSPLVPVFAVAGAVVFSLATLGAFHLLAAPVPWSSGLIWQVGIVAALDGVLLPLFLAGLAVVDRSAARSPVLIG
jgi:rod shape-determining protein MreD